MLQHRRTTKKRYRRKGRKHLEKGRRGEADAVRGEHAGYEGGRYPGCEGLDALGAGGGRDEVVLVVLAAELLEGLALGLRKKERGEDSS